MIRPVAAGDAEAISGIYAWYVENTAITFDVEVPSVDAWRAKIEAARHPWVGLEEEGALAGFAYATEFRPRAAYDLTCETTVYLRDGAAGRGLGRALYGALLDAVDAGGFHRALAVITLPNDASVALHEHLGFERVGVLDQAGRKFDRWHDVGFWLRRRP
jgi:phosphinothricin acetyltransferase